MLRCALLFGIVSMLASAGCVEDNGLANCAPGSSQPCTCGNVIGIAFCGEDRRFGECLCDVPGASMPVVSIPYTQATTCRLGPASGAGPVEGTGAFVLDAGRVITWATPSRNPGGVTAGVNLWTAVQGPEVGEVTSRFALGNQIWFRDGSDVNVLDEGTVVTVATCPAGATGGGLAHALSTGDAWYDCDAALYRVDVGQHDGSSGTLAVDLPGALVPGSLRYAGGLAWQQVETDTEPRRFCLLDASASVQCNAMVDASDTGLCGRGQADWDFQDGRFACVAPDDGDARLFQLTTSGTPLELDDPPSISWAGTDGTSLFFVDAGQLYRQTPDSALERIDGLRIGALWDAWSPATGSEVYLCGRNPESDAVVVWRYRP